MELTINIKEQQKISFFLKLLQEFDYIEIMDIKEDETPFSGEHKALLEERLKKIETGETSFRNWDTIKQKYEEKTI
jgi:hypothetical protein